MLETLRVVFAFRRSVQNLVGYSSARLTTMGKGLQIIRGEVQFDTSRTFALVAVATFVVALELVRAARRRFEDPPRMPTPSPPGRRFEGKVAVVTGGARGIGRAVALALSREGAEVVVADLLTCDEANALEPADAEEAKTWTWHRVDAASASDIENCCNWIPQCDVLVNNVAVQPEAPCHKHPLSEWDRAIAVNLTSYFLFAKHLLPKMIINKKTKRPSSPWGEMGLLVRSSSDDDLTNRGGAIVNMASVQGLASQAGIPGYAAAKGGVLSLTRQLAVEYAKSGVRVNAVSPGTINTPLVASVIEKRGSSLAEAGAVYPCGRVGEPHEIAAAVLWLASDEAGFVTGQNLTVDGGIMSRGGWAAVA